MPPAGLIAGLVDDVVPQPEEPTAETAAATTQAKEVNTKPGTLIPIGQGLPALPKKMIEKILSYDYVDFSELPPAKGKVRAMTPSMEGQVILVQAEDLLQTKKLIPDFQTWVQCFAIYVAVIAPKQPERVPDLMAYANNIARASKKFKWPAWVVYDQNFRQEAMCNPSQPWAKIDPSIYSQCFLGMARSAEGWCQWCQSLEHTSEMCPGGPSSSRKRPWRTAFPSPGREPTAKPVCLKFNRSDGECSFGPRCKFLHCCSRCRGNHPLKRCTAPVDDKEKAA